MLRNFVSLCKKGGCKRPFREALRLWALVRLAGKRGVLINCRIGKQAAVASELGSEAFLYNSYFSIPIKEIKLMDFTELKAVDRYMVRLENEFKIKSGGI